MNILKYIMAPVITLIIGFFLGALYVKARNEKEDKVFYSFVYNEILLFVTPLSALMGVLIYSLINKSTLLALFAICIALPIIFMENALKRRSFPNASFDIITARFFERGSYILFILGLIFGILFAAQKLGLIK